MGKGRDKRKKAKGSSTAGHGAAKTEQKTRKNEEKKLRREAGDGEDDIDAILAELDRENGALQQGPIVTADVAPPGPRICCAWQPNGDQACPVAALASRAWQHRMHADCLATLLALMHERVMTSVPNTTFNCCMRSCTRLRNSQGQTTYIAEERGDRAVWRRAVGSGKEQNVCV